MGHPRPGSNQTGVGESAMLIPSMDLMDGHIVQLVQGDKKAHEFSDLEPWLQKFEKYPLVQVVDLDAAMHKGSNQELVTALCQRLTCQVGGGISTVARAREVLAAGAKRVIIGSALFADGKINTELAKELAAAIGADKLVFSVDSKHGRIAVKGWSQTVPISAVDAIKELDPYCKAFLYTHIDNEGLMGGFPAPLARDLVAATKKHMIVAGGINSIEEVQQLDLLGADAVVGMAIYSGAMEA